MSDDDVRAAGMAVRRRILGDAHVDRAIANSTDLTEEFQDFLTRYGWGEVWTRPGFDYRTRRILVLGTMLAIGRWEEFRMHLRAALADGFTLADVKELMHQQAIYCGLPPVNTGFHHVNEVIKDLTSQGVQINKG
jgi:4-carboxymuconolactone decarboxylase